MMERSRITALAVLILLPLGGLQVRLVHLQLAEAHHYAGDLNARRRSLDLAPAPRGRIVDIHGRVLAEDQRSFDVHLVIEEHEKSPAALPALLGATPAAFREAVEKIYARIERQVRRRPPAEHRRLYARERSTPYLLLRNIPFETALAIETSPHLYPGAVVRESLRRRYPFEAVGCHFVGYLGRVISNEEEFRSRCQNGYFWEGFEDVIGQDGIAQLYRRGAFHEEMIGRAGLERSYDEDLRGRPGLVIFEREAGTSVRQTVEIKTPRPGQDVEITIDIEFQSAVEREIARDARTAVVVMDPETGALLALASNRGFDPNAFIPPGDPEQVRAATTNQEDQPLVSRAYARQAQLGSIFKVVTAVAGIEERKIAPDAILPCHGRYLPTSRHFACWIWNQHQGAHGDLVIAQALEQSCNPFFYEVGRRCGLETLSRWGALLGFGARTGIDLPGEAAGALPRRARGEHDVLSLAIGQHELMVTPLQAAVMMAAIANGGHRVTPHLRRRGDPGRKPLGISPATITEVRKGLQAVAQGAHGTARTALGGFEAKGFPVAGKTSSAQTLEGRNSHAWFAGYVPADKPRYVLVVFMEYGGGGGAVAAPVAAKILDLLAARR